MATAPWACGRGMGVSGAGSASTTEVAWDNTGAAAVVPLVADWSVEVAAVGFEVSGAVRSGFETSAGAAGEG